MLCLNQVSATDPSSSPWRCTINECFHLQTIYLWNYCCLFSPLGGTNSLWKHYELFSTGSQSSGLLSALDLTGSAAFAVRIPLFLLLNQLYPISLNQCDNFSIMFSLLLVVANSQLVTIPLRSPQNTGLKDCYTVLPDA